MNELQTGTMRTEAVKTVRLAVPIIIGELAQLLLHVIDAAMVGAIGYRQLAAAALVVNVVNVPFVLGIGATIAVSQMVSMANGRKDSRMVSHYLFNGVVLCAAVALVIGAALAFSRGVLQHLGQDPEVVRLAMPFMELMAWSLVPMILFMTLKHFSDGLELARIPMALSLAALPLNIFLNWLLIYGNLGFPRLELIGSGWATLITRSLIFISLLLVILFHRSFKPYIELWRTEWKLKKETLRELLRIGVPSGLQIGIEVTAFAVSGIIIGTIGAVEQAAHQIALSYAALTFMVSMGLAQAGSIRVSNAYGRLDWSRIRVIGKGTWLMALAYGIFCAVLMGIFHKQLPHFFNKNPGVVSLAGILLLLAAVFQVSDSTQATGAGLLRGVKDTRIPTVLIAIAYWVIGLPVGYLFAFNFGLGAVGMWLGLITGLSFASALLLLRFRRVTGKSEAISRKS
jgi:MATE family multidrug resistance protein